MSGISGEGTDRVDWILGEGFVEEENDVEAPKTDIGEEGPSPTARTVEVGRFLAAGGGADVEAAASASSFADEGRRLALVETCR